MEHFDHAHEEGAHTHQHAHEGEDGTYTHTHPHTHGDGHTHEHGGEQAAAVLRYMLEHNIHHAGELSDLARQFSGEVQHQLLHAVESFDQANGYLSAALELLKEQSSK